jgi:general stress protein YciG
LPRVRIPNPNAKRGFALMDKEDHRRIASKGGQSVPEEKRYFSKNPEFAAKAGRKGGQSVEPEKRSFSQDRDLAAKAGRKGGEARAENAGTRRKPPKE